MAKPKMDKVKLNKMLRAGKTVKECAKFFGVTPGRVCQIKKELNISVVKSVALENAHRVVGHNLDAIQQLQVINEHASWLLEHVMKWVKGDEGAIQILEESARKVNVGTKKDPKWVTKYKFKDPHEIALKAMAEIRGQLGLQLDIFKTMCDLETVREFQAEVLGAIAAASPEVRDEIVKRLQKARALRCSVQVH